MSNDNSSPHNKSYPPVEIESLLGERKIKYILSYSDGDQTTYKLLITSVLDTFVCLEYDGIDTDAEFYMRMPGKYQDVGENLMWYQDYDEPSGVTFEDVLDQFIDNAKKMAECLFKIQNKLDEIKFNFKSYELNHEDFITLPSDFESNL